MIELDITTRWPDIRKHFKLSFSTNFHVSIASNNAQGLPVNTPIGSLFLNRDYSGFYFEKYPSTLPENVDVHPEICVLAVNSGTLFWLRSLLYNRFQNYPAVRLYGSLGKLRKPGEIETKRLKRRMRATRLLAGNKTLWGDMSRVREIHFTRAERVHLGSMTKKLKT
ncbi:MAG: pyridoxamine 5'-phosphate oxidase family protein [Candidatus Marinimicrobia bacterium]|nr:pyridoxamine 5'-phosphate oxidase family protein [Candidatus Neomarinimicrobiota bacterium]